MGTFVSRTLSQACEPTSASKPEPLFTFFHLIPLKADGLEFRSRASIVPAIIPTPSWDLISFAKVRLSPHPCNSFPTARAPISHGLNNTDSHTPWKRVKSLPTGQVHRRKHLRHHPTPWIYLPHQEKIFPIPEKKFHHFTTLPLPPRQKGKK